MKTYYFTETGYEKLGKEIERLQRHLKQDIAKEIATAREHGDLRENAEYEAAKMKQANYMAKLNHLEEKISQARIIRKEDLPANIVTLGKKVAMLDLANNKTITYSILGDGESDIDNGIISYQSPLAQALMKHKVNDEVEVRLPKGSKKYKILEITFFEE